MRPNLARGIFMTAALANIGGVLLFCKGFTNTVLNEADPTLFSNFGLLMIGLGRPFRGRQICAQNPLRHLASRWKKPYTSCLDSMSNHKDTLPDLFADVFAETFMSIYGIVLATCSCSLGVLGFPSHSRCHRLAFVAPTRRVVPQPAPVLRRQLQE